METGIKHFPCDEIEKALLRVEWEKWLRAFELYLAAEEIISVEKKRNKLLHLAGPQLQEVAYNIPGALAHEEGVDGYQTLINKLSEYFSPKRNSVFERHVFRAITVDNNENFNKFLLRVRQQAAKCTFGNTEVESREINIRDKIIDNWAPVELKKKLLEKEFSTAEIIEFCRVHEQIVNQSKAMETTQSQSKIPLTELSVNKISGYRNPNDIKCSRCGRGGHPNASIDCPARALKCNKCGKKGHFANCCRTRKNVSTDRSTGSNRYNTPSKHKRINFVGDDPDSSEVEDNANSMKNFDCFRVTKSILRETRDDLITCCVGGSHITFLIDSGSRANIVKGSDWETLVEEKAVLWGENEESKDVLKAYGTDKPIHVKHRFQTTISIPGKSEICADFYVVSDGDISLLGKDTAKQLGILQLGVNINRVDKIAPFPKITNVTVKLTIDLKVKPVQQPLRRIPISVEGKVEEKLQEALAKDIIEKVTEPSPWISPIVVIFKNDDSIRICVDMRRANQAILRENYPLPTFDSFTSKLANIKYFSKLDLTNAYHQLELDKDSRYITTFITHKGMFRYKRLMFGVNSAPEIFQRVFEGILAPSHNCWNYLDDIIVYGSSEEEHNNCLDKVLKLLKEANVVLNENKCQFKVQELDFLGHHLSYRGLDADSKKIQSILEFRPPNTKEEVRSFLGLVTYVGKFIADLSMLTEPLRELTKKDVTFVWEQVHQCSFDKLKQSLARLPTLSFFDPKCRTRLIADASPVALGAVLLQFNKGDPRIISFASKTLSRVERRYSQTEKESLALVWAVERFFYYLTGLEFELVTDHKPLETIFKPTSKPPARIERWALRLQSYKFRVIYQSGKSNIADSLSRLCAGDFGECFDQEGERHVFAILKHNTPRALSVSNVLQSSKQDLEITAALTKLADNSWALADKNPYYPFRLELTNFGPILLRGNKLIIPADLRKQTLELAHEGHPGETVMKRRLRAKVWWPKIDRQVEQFVKLCRDCLIVSKPNCPPPMARHEFPSGPWQCLATDLLGPLPSNEYILVVIDYYSRYYELKFLRTITSAVIIGHLREMFARLGIPLSIRADNGRQFISQEFQEFCSINNIDLIKTPPYWPQANGEVENMNRSLLKRLQICHTNGTDYKTEIQKFILMYNATPQGTTGKSPTELLYNRNIRDKIPCLQDLSESLLDGETRDHDLLMKTAGKEREDLKRRAVVCDIQTGDKVLVKNLVKQNKLTPTFGTTEYEVINTQGNEALLSHDSKVFRRHLAHLKKIPTPISNATTSSSEASNLQEPHGQPTDDEISQETPPKVQPMKLKKKDGMWHPVIYEAEERDSETKIEGRRGNAA